MDISDKEKVYEVAKRVKQEIGKVDILINNAGIVTCRTLLDLPDKAIETTYGVNILSHYWASRKPIFFQPQSNELKIILDDEGVPS